MGSYLEIREMTKSFGSVVAVNDVSFSVDKGEFFTFLGPSGCGKTTLLRCIGGFETPEKGQILIGGRELADVPPNKRDIGFVFQNYALFPTMNVFKNVAFGLEMRKLPAQLIRKKVAEALALVGLTGYGNRRTKQLSGGQQQRVALARALVIEPQILLLDEPLSNLDAKLRVEMRVNISRLQRKLNITTIYVTHDQEEAFSLSDRIMVMNQGFKQQIGTHSELYYEPHNEFVADFIGQANFVDGKILRPGRQKLTVQALGTEITTAGFAEGARSEGALAGDGVKIMIRPEQIAINPGEEIKNRLRGTITERQFLGSFLVYYIQTAESELIVKIPGISRSKLSLQPAVGDEVTIGFRAEDCTIV